MAPLPMSLSRPIILLVLAALLLAFAAPAVSPLSAGTVRELPSPAIAKLLENPSRNATGLWYQRLRNRWYDAAVGRFISRDPIGFRGGLNLYGYVNNSPISDADPLGLCGTKMQKQPGETEQEFYERWNVIRAEEVFQFAENLGDAAARAFLVASGGPVGVGVVALDALAEPTAAVATYAGDSTTQNRDVALKVIFIELLKQATARAIEAASRTDIKKKGTGRNPDGTVKRADEQLNQIQKNQNRVRQNKLTDDGLPEEGDIIENINKSEQNLRNKLRNYDPRDWEDD